MAQTFGIIPASVFKTAAEKAKEAKAARIAAAAARQKEAQERKAEKRKQLFEKRLEEKKQFREALSNLSGAERVSHLIGEKKSVKISVKAFIWKFANTLAAGKEPTVYKVENPEPPLYCPVCRTLINIGEECFGVAGFPQMRMSKAGYEAVKEYIETDEYKNNARAKEEVSKIAFESNNIVLSKETQKTLEESGLLGKQA